MTTTTKTFNYCSSELQRNPTVVEPSAESIDELQDTDIDTRAQKVGHPMKARCDVVTRGSDEQILTA